MRKAVILWVVTIVALAVYLNIGWALGTYMHNNVKYTAPKSFTAKVLAGPHLIFSKLDRPENERNSLLDDQVFASFIWPLALCVFIGVWAGYAIYWIAWIVFAGGLAKLFGIG